MENEKPGFLFYILVAVLATPMIMWLVLIETAALTIDAYEDIEKFIEEIL